jgi:cytochrome c biogenesis protein ResB
MNEPTPKRFLSKVKIYHADGKIEDKTIEVNKPFKIDGWYIYQSGYNGKMRKWSTTSVFEFVRDPWLYLIYSGIIMLLAGACFMIIYDKFV